MERKRFNFRIIFALISLLIASFCKISIYQNNSFIILILGSVLTSFFLYVAYLGNESIIELTYPYEVDDEKDRYYLDWKSKQKTAIMISVLSLFVSFFLIAAINNGRKNNKLQIDGLNAKAIVTNGEQIVHQSLKRRWTENKIAIKFKTQDGQDISTYLSVSENEYKKVFVGKEVLIVYDPKEPQITNILVDKESIRTYSEIAERSIDVEDLIRIFNSSNINIKKEILDKISVGWAETEIKGFENQEKKEGLLQKENTLLYTINTKIQRNNSKFLKPLNIIDSTLLSTKRVILPGPLPFDNTVKIYNSKDYTILVNSEADSVEVRKDIGIYIRIGTISYTYLITKK